MCRALPLTGSFIAPNGVLVVYFLLIRIDLYNPRYFELFYSIFYVKNGWAVQFNLSQTVRVLVELASQFNNTLFFIERRPMMPKYIVFILKVSDHLIASYNLSKHCSLSFRPIRQLPLTKFDVSVRLRVQCQKTEDWRNKRLIFQQNMTPADPLPIMRPSSVFSCQPQNRGFWSSLPNPIFSCLWPKSGCLTPVSALSLAGFTGSLVGLQLGNCHEWPCIFERGKALEAEVLFKAGGARLLFQRVDRSSI